MERQEPKPLNTKPKKPTIVMTALSYARLHGGRNFKFDNETTLAEHRGRAYECRRFRSPNHMIGDLSAINAHTHGL
jgi:hypothetical protein